VDLGAGTGLITAALAARGAHVLAVEIDPSLLDDPDGGLVRADLVVQWQVAHPRGAVPAPAFGRRGRSRGHARARLRLALSGRECQHGLALGPAEC
jgi:hypothetical protein